MGALSSASDIQTAFDIYATVDIGGDHLPIGESTYRQVGVTADNT
ncbi:hypothetical protein [Haloferax sp. CBA1148]|nr:hypothetical protein [Haloferax sp. CBA1148]